jgi:hypothetical protein
LKGTKNTVYRWCETDGKPREHGSLLVLMEDGQSTIGLSLMCRHDKRRQRQIIAVLGGRVLGEFGAIPGIGYSVIKIAKAVGKR